MLVRVRVLVLVLVLVVCACARGRRTRACVQVFPVTEELAPETAVPGGYLEGRAAQRKSWPLQAVQHC